MSTARLRRPAPRGAGVLAALAALSALAAAAGCAREGAAPGPSLGAQAAPAMEAPNAPPTAAPSAPAGSSAVPAAPASAPLPAATAPTPGGASALAAILAAGAAAPSMPELTLEQMQRRSPSAALVETFNAACSDPARNAVRRAAKRLEFTPVASGAPREGPGAAAASPEGGEAWRGPEEVGGAVLVWDEATSTCELRAQGVDLLLVESAFSRLPQALEEDGASVTRLPPPPTLASGVRTRQMLLVQPGRFSRPERARVLRLGHHLGARGAEAAAGGDTVTLSARAVSAPR